MKVTLILMFLLACLEGISQSQMDTSSYSGGSVKSWNVIGEGYIYAPSVTMYGKDSLVIRTDSITAIRELWKELKRRESERNEYDQSVFNIIQAQNKEITRLRGIAQTCIDESRKLIKDLRDIWAKKPAK